MIAIMLAVAAMADSRIDDAMRVSAGLAAVAMLCVATIGLVDDVRKCLGCTAYGGRS